MRNLLAAAEAGNVRVVHIDNMYQYGPQDEPLHEDMPLTSHGVKPAVRSEITGMWKKAAREGRVRWASLRAPDFYGAGVGRSHIGDTGLAAIAKGKAAMMLMNPDQPHAFAYVPDIARAALSLLDAGDDAFNQVWHVPCAPTRTARELLQMGADAVGQKLKVVAIPTPLLQVLGLVVPFMKEYAELRFTWTRPYHVDATKFSRRFWSDATPFAVGIPAAMRSFPTAEPTLKSIKKSRGHTSAATTATS
jgi:nucleoside-diphosphate-sugar epimerase